MRPHRAVHFKYIYFIGNRTQNNEMGKNAANGPGDDWSAPVRRYICSSYSFMWFEGECLQQPIPGAHMMEGA